MKKSEKKTETMSFTERKIVNGSSLRQFGGQNVSIFVNVEPQAERNANEFTGKTSDDVTVKVILDERLNVELHGWVEVIGQVQSAATIVSKEVSATRDNSLFVF